MEFSSRINHIERYSQVGFKAEFTRFFSQISKMLRKNPGERPNSDNILKGAKFWRVRKTSIINDIAEVAKLLDDENKVWLKMFLKNKK